MNRTTTLTTLALITALTTGLTACEPTTEPGPNGSSGSNEVETVADQDGDGFTVEDGDCNDTDARWQPVTRDRLVERRTIQTATEAERQVRETVSEYDVFGNVVLEQDSYTYPILVMGHRFDLEVMDEHQFDYTPTGKLKTQIGEMRLQQAFNGLEVGSIVGVVERDIEYDGNDEMVTDSLREWISGSGVTIKDITEYREYRSGQLLTHERDWNEPGHFDGYDHEIGVSQYNYDANGDLASVNEEQLRKWDHGSSSAPATIDTEYTRDSTGAVLTYRKVTDFFADGAMDSRFDAQQRNTFEYNEFGLPTVETYRMIDHWEDRTQEKLNTYDEEGRLIGLEKTDGEETLVLSYTYNATGYLETERTTFMDGEWEELTHSYDEAGRLVAVRGVTHTNYVYREASYEYDADGRILSETVHNDGDLYSQIENTYHADGALLKRVRSEQGTVVTDTFDMTFACP